MKHLYDNEGEVVAADTPEQASQYFNEEFGPFKAEDVEQYAPGNWKQLADTYQLRVGFEDAPEGEPKEITQTCAQWAADESEPNHVCSDNC